MLHWLRTEDRNILIFHYLTFTRSAVFLNGNWIFFWLRVMTYGQLGLIDAVSFLFGLIMEVPTGAISDLIGKRFTLMLSMLLTGSGFIIMGAGDTLAVLVLGFWVTQVGWAFYSGADEAMAYDSLKERGQALRFDRVISLTNIIGILTLVICTLIGGILYRIDMRLPHYAWGVLLLTGFVAACCLREPALAREPFSFKNYRRQITRGLHQLAQPELRLFLPLILTLLGIAYLFNFGLIQPAVAESFGFFADEQAVVYAVVAAVTAITTAGIPWLRRRFSELTILSTLGLITTLGFLGAALPLGAWGFFALLLIRTGGAMSTPWISIIVNHRIASEDRATTLSTVALLTKLPYVLTAMIAGSMAQSGTLWLFNLVVAGIMLLAVVLTLAVVARRPRVGPALPPAAD
ncbi:MAG: MFS transporter [Anaerolineae bacterium]|nr:MFS transporter [Anaerolineae bacterium]